MAQEKFKTHEIVPGIVKTAPASVLQVKFKSGVQANLGDEVTPQQVKDEPNVSWPAEEKALYTLAMIDPDAPTRKSPIAGQMKHWLVVNIPGTKISDGQVLAEFRGSGPVQCSGKKRYIFLVYKQPGRITSDEVPIDKNTVEGRPKFNVQAFADKHNLGGPIAGNFYYAQWDDYCAALYKERDLKIVELFYSKHEVIPDVIRTLPTSILQAKYNSGHEEVFFGDELTPRQVKDQPEIKWTADEAQLYTLIMTDLDVPSRKDRSDGEFLHWTVVNIPGNRINQGQVLAEYIGSGPPEGSGLHRYVFVVYKQPGSIKPDEKAVDKHTVPGRPKFKTQAFAEKYKLGEPVAGNFYQAQWDDYVPELYKQFTS